MSAESNKAPKITKVYRDKLTEIAKNVKVVTSLYKKFPSERSKGLRVDKKMIVGKTIYDENETVTITLDQVNKMRDALMKEIKDLGKIYKVKTKPTGKKGGRNAHVYLKERFYDWLRPENWPREIADMLARPEYRYHELDAAGMRKPVPKDILSKLFPIYVNNPANAEEITAVPIDQYGNPTMVAKVVNGVKVLSPGSKKFYVPAAKMYSELSKDVLNMGTLAPFVREIGGRIEYGIRTQDAMKIHSKFFLKQPNVKYAQADQLIPSQIEALDTYQKQNKQTLADNSAAIYQVIDQYKARVKATKK